MSEKRDVRISGIGNVESGSYNNLTLSGVVQMNGEIKCAHLDVSGSSKSYAKLQTDVFRISGVMQSFAPIESKKFTVSGTFKNDESSIHTEHMHISGILKSAGSIQATTLLVDGLIHVNDVFCDEIDIRNAQHISIFSLRKSSNYAKHIVCRKINASYLKCKSIHADVIVLGKNCVIDNIYCEGKLVMERNSKVKNIIGNCIVERR